jgi:hypothetical protein
MLAVQAKGARKFSRAVIPPVRSASVVTAEAWLYYGFAGLAASVVADWMGRLPDIFVF